MTRRYIACAASQIGRGYPKQLPGGAEAAVHLLFIHDTNQLYLRQLLQLDWISRGWPTHAAPTGGHILFEVLCDDDCYVRVVFRAQSPAAQRAGDQGPPETAVLIIPRCGEELCPLDRFVQIVLDVVALDCVPAGLREALVSMAPPAETRKRRGRSAPPPAVAALALLAATFLGVGLGVFISRGAPGRRPSATSLLRASSSRETPEGHVMLTRPSGSSGADDGGGAEML